jgi:tetratricopeptide (TPR) repeat protein
MLRKITQTAHVHTRSLRAFVKISNRRWYTTTNIGQLFHDGKFEQVIQEASTQTHYDRLVNDMRNKSLINLNRLDEAQTFVTQDLQRDPNNFAHAISMALIFMEQGKHEEGLPWIEKAYEMGADEKFYYSCKSQVLYNLNRDEEARSLVTEFATNTDPAFAPFILIALQNVKRYDAIVKQYEALADLFPEDDVQTPDVTAAKSLYLNALMETGKFEQAERFLEQLKNAGLPEEPYHLFYEKLVTLQGKTYEKPTWRRPVSEMSEKEIELRIKIEEMQKQDIENIAPLVAQFKEISPDGSFLTNYLHFLFESGQDQTFLELFDWITKHTSPKTRVVFWIFKFMALERTGQYDKISSVLDKAIRSDPKDAVNYAVKGLWLARLNQAQDVIFNYKIAEELGLDIDSIELPLSTKTNAYAALQDAPNTIACLKKLEKFSHAEGLEREIKWVEIVSLYLKSNLKQMIQLAESYQPLIPDIRVQWILFVAKYYDQPTRKSVNEHLAIPLSFAAISSEEVEQLQVQETAITAQLMQAYKADTMIKKIIQDNPQAQSDWMSFLNIAKPLFKMALADSTLQQIPESVQALEKMNSI